MNCEAPPTPKTLLRKSIHEFRIDDDVEDQEKLKKEAEEEEELKFEVEADVSEVDGFLEKCFYVQGQYDSTDDFDNLATFIQEQQRSKTETDNALTATKSEEKVEGSFMMIENRIFYFALPPSLYASVAPCVKLDFVKYLIHYLLDLHCFLQLDLIDWCWRSLLGEIITLA